MLVKFSCKEALHRVYVVTAGLLKPMQHPYNLSTVALARVAYGHLLRRIYPHHATLLHLRGPPGHCTLQ